MKLTKLLFLALIASFTFSCSEDTTEDSIVNPEGQFDDSRLGDYKGIFTTVDGLTRGHVVMTLSAINEGIAQITLSTGEVVELKSLPVQLTADNTVSNLRFSSLGLSSTQAELNFSVEANGLNPVISEVSFDNKESEIAVAKDLARAPANTLTGTYDCTNCSAIGVGFPNGRTWNVMSVGEGDQTYTVQIAYDNRVYTTTVEQANCTTNPFGSDTSCTIEGSTNILGFELEFIGQHFYPNSEELSCSAVSGEWTAPEYGPGAMGTFISDSTDGPNGIQCN